MTISSSSTKERRYPINNSIDNSFAFSLKGCIIGYSTWSPVLLNPRGVFSAGPILSLPKHPPAKNLKLKFSELENALNQTLASVQSLGASAEENVCKLSDEEIAAVPSEIAQDIAKRIRAAAEMGDVMTLNAIAEEIKDQSDSCIPLSKQIVQMAEDFDLDGIQKLADALDAC